MRPNLSAIDEAVPSLLDEVAESLILPRFRRLGASEVQTKTHANDLVTIADIEAEAWLTPRLQALLPSSLALGEEAASRGEVSNQILDGAAPVWTIDPVDGTYNFVQGSDDFCAMIALVHNRAVLGGWIYFPTRRLHFSALKGQGTYRSDAKNTRERLDLTRLNAADLANLPAALSHRFWKREALKARKQQTLASLSPTTKTTCAGLNYCDLAEGKTALVAMATLTPWDHAPGTLIAQEAGAEVILNGGAYDPRVETGALISGRASKRRDLAVKAFS